MGRQISFRPELLSCFRLFCFFVVSDVWYFARGVLFVGATFFPNPDEGVWGQPRTCLFSGGLLPLESILWTSSCLWVFRRLRIDSRGLFVCFLESGGCSRNFERGSGNGGKGPLFLSAFPFLQRMSEILRDKHATFWGVFGGLESILGSNRDFRVGRFHKIDFRGLFACFYFFVLTNTDFVVQYLCLD